MTMKKRCVLTWLTLLAVFLIGRMVRAVQVIEGGKRIIPDRISRAVKIDGDLEEAVWQQPSINKEFISLYPTYGEVLNHKTEIWTAYDNHSLYFAIKCYDPEPHKIKASISQRDKIVRDDMIAILLDTMGTKQTSYEFYINPRGIQGDSLYTAVGGSDLAPDFVWDSAGKITDEGYQVEVRIPLESVRFKSGKEVEMGILFVRQISRLGMSGSWPETKPGHTDFNFMSTIVYRNLKKPMRLEILPNFIYSKNNERENAETWGTSDIDKNIGIGVKYGITSSITAEAAVNPDFSQVESDAFQVEVNRRYPVFYSEKRPFFMEGMDVFDFGIIARGMMTSAVHTRRIIDPSWAAKLSGGSGKMSFALLTAEDSAPGRPGDTGVDIHEGKRAFFGIARAKYNLGSDNFLGVLYSGRHFADTHNDVFGADLQYQLLKNLRTTISYLYSATRDSETAPVRHGSGLNAMVRYSTPKFNATAAYERYDREFSMASAFQVRSELSHGWVYAGPQFYPTIKGIKWLRRVHPYVIYSTLHDLATKMDDNALTLGIRMSFTRQGSLTVEYWKEKEAWAYQTFDKSYISTYGSVQLFKWLNISGNISGGDRIYYHPSEPFLGDGITWGCELTVEPSEKLKVGFDYSYTNLYKKENHQKSYSYSVDIFNLHTTYQFNKYFFVRGNIRYDNYREKLLTDFLASFTFIPGTVVHLGYGSLYEKKEWQDNQWVPGGDDFLEMKRGLFFKASYLLRIK